DAEMIRKKIMKAKTDAGPQQPNAAKPDYIENLFVLMRLVSSKDTVQKFQADYDNCTIRYGDLKKQLAEDMVKFISPLRDKAVAIQNDKSYLSKVIKQGKEKARTSADATLQLVRNAIGVNYV